MKKKRIVSLVLAMVLAFSLVGCDSNTDKAPVISSPEATFDAGIPNDVSFDVDMKSKKLLGISQGNSDLSAENYSYGDGTLTVKSAYLLTLEPSHYNFTLSTEGGEATFGITVTNSKYLQIADAVLDLSVGGNVMLTLDLKGNSLSFIKDKSNDVMLAMDVDFVYREDSFMLILYQAGYLGSLKVGSYVFTVATAKGSGDFTLNIVEDNIDETQLIYILPHVPGANVSFTLSTNGFPLSEVTLGDTVLTEEVDYSFDGSKITVKGPVIADLSVGIYPLNITVDNSEKDEFLFYIGSYGKEGEARVPGSVPDYSKLNNFEQYVVGDSVIYNGSKLLQNTLDPSASNEIVTGEDALVGKQSIKFYPGQGSNSGEKFGVFFGTVGPDDGFKVNTLYALKLKVRMNKAQTLLFMFENATAATSGQNAFMMRNNKENVSSVDGEWTKDSRSNAVYNSEGNYWDVTVYLYTDKAQDKLVMRTFAAGGVTPELGHSVIIDDLMIVEAGMPIRPEVAPVFSAADNVYRGEDISFHADITTGYRVSGVYLGETALKADTDYRYDVQTGTLTILNSYLSTASLPLTLEVRTQAVADIFGGLTGTDLVSSISIKNSLPHAGTTGIINVKSTGSRAGKAEFPLYLEDHKIDSVALEDLDKNGGDDSKTDIGAENYSFDHNVLTIDKDFILQLRGAGRYVFTVKTSHSVNGANPISFKFVVNYDMGFTALAGGPASFSEYIFTNEKNSPSLVSGTHVYTANTAFGYTNVLRFMNETLSYGLSTGDDFNGKVLPSDMLMVKLRIRMSDAANAALCLQLGDVTMLNWNGESGEWTSDTVYTVVDLGDGYYDVCAYAYGNSAKVDVKVKGDILFGEMLIHKVKGVSYAALGD